MLLLVVAYPVPLPLAVTVIATVPGVIPVTTPEAETDAMVGAALEKVVLTATVFAVASTEELRPNDCPTVIVALVGESVTPRIASGGGVVGGFEDTMPSPPPQAVAANSRTKRELPRRVRRGRNAGRRMR
ncbi:MAG: hypothetical protein ABMA00_10270 [Gemmatimonas sp.]